MQQPRRRQQQLLELQQPQSQEEQQPFLEQQQQEPPLEEQQHQQHKHLLDQQLQEKQQKQLQDHHQQQQQVQQREQLQQQQQQQHVQSLEPRHPPARQQAEPHEQLQHIVGRLHRESILEEQVEQQKLLLEQQHEQQQMLLHQQLQQFQRLEQQGLSLVEHQQLARRHYIEQQTLLQEQEQQMRRLQSYQHEQVQQHEHRQLQQQLVRHRSFCEKLGTAGSRLQPSGGRGGSRRSSSELPCGLVAVGTTAAVAGGAAAVTQTPAKAATTTARASDATAPTATATAKSTDTERTRFPAAAAQLMRGCLSKQLCGPQFSELALLPRLFHILAHPRKIRSSSNNNNNDWVTGESNNSTGSVSNHSTGSRELYIQAAEVFARELLRRSVLRDPISAMKALIVAHRLLAQVPVDAFLGSSLQKLPGQILRIWSATALHPAAAAAADGNVGTASARPAIATAKAAAAAASTAEGAVCACADFFAEKLRLHLQLVDCCTGTWSVSRFLRANGVSLETLVAFEEEGVVALNASVSLQLVSMLHRACTLCLLLLQQRGTSLFAVSSIYLVLLVDDIWGVAALLLRLLHALLQRCMRPAVAASGGAALVAILVSLANPLKDALKDMQLAAEKCAAAANCCSLLQRMRPPPPETLLLLDDLKKQHQQQQQSSRLLLPRTQLLPYRPSSAARRSMQAVAQLPLPADLEAVAAAASAAGREAAAAAATADGRWIEFLNIEEVYWLVKGTSKEMELVLQEHPRCHRSRSARSTSSSNSNSPSGHRVGVSTCQRTEREQQECCQWQGLAPHPASEEAETARAAVPAAMVPAESRHLCFSTQCSKSSPAEGGSDKTGLQNHKQHAEDQQRHAQHPLYQQQQDREIAVGSIGGDSRAAAGDAEVAFAPPEVTLVATRGDPISGTSAAPPALAAPAAASADAVQGSPAVASFDAELRSLTWGVHSLQHTIQQKTQQQNVLHPQECQQEYCTQHYIKQYELQQQQCLQQQLTQRQSIQQQEYQLPQDQQQQQHVGVALQLQQLQQTGTPVEHSQSRHQQQQQRKQHWLHSSAVDTLGPPVCQSEFPQQVALQQQHQQLQQLQQQQPLLQHPDMLQQAQVQQLCQQPVSQQELQLQHLQQYQLQQQLLLHQQTQPSLLQHQSYYLQENQQLCTQPQYQQQQFPHQLQHLLQLQRQQQQLQQQQMQQQRLQQQLHQHHHNQLLQQQQQLQQQQLQQQQLQQQQLQQLQQQQQQQQQQQLQQQQLQQQLQKQHHHQLVQTSVWRGMVEGPSWSATPPSAAAAVPAAAAPGGAIALGCDCVACRCSIGRSSCCLRGLKARLEALNLGVDPRELKINYRIGSGASGTVLKAAWRGCDVAVKVLPMVQQHLLQQEQQQGRRASAAAAVAAAAAARELQIMKRLRCPNLVLLMGACALDADGVCSSNGSIDESSRNSSSSPLSSNSAAELLAASGCCGPGLAVVMELCAGGSLFGLLHGKPEDALAAVAVAPSDAPATAEAVELSFFPEGTAAIGMAVPSCDAGAFTSASAVESKAPFQDSPIVPRCGTLGGTTGAAAGTARKTEAKDTKAIISTATATYDASDCRKQQEYQQKRRHQQEQVQEPQPLPQPPPQLPSQQLPPQHQQQPQHPHEQRRRLTWEQKLKVALDVARGCAYLHASQPPVVHRDLKSLNILLVERITSDKQMPVAKVGDFGLSRLATAAGCSDDSSSTPAAAAVAGATAVRLGGCSYKAAPTPAPIRTRAVGTVHWMPPEVMRGLPQGPPVDVFAFGIVLYELAAEALPYLRPRDTPLHQPQQEHQQHIDRTNVWLPPPGDICAAVLRGERPDERLILPMCPPVLRNLMRRCWAEDPWERPTFAEVVEELKAALQTS